MEEKIKNLAIYTDYCFRCGKEFDDNLKSTKHHCIPTCLRPRDNVIILLCPDCHKEINDMYVQQVPKTKITRKINPLMVKLTGLESKTSKVMKGIEDLKKEMGEIKDE